MNDFGVPATDADINMTSNPAKAMLDQQMATTGRENNWFFPLLGAAVSIGGSVIAGNKQAASEKAAAEENNEATERRYEYDVKGWEMDAQSIVANRDFAIQEIQTKAKNEGKVADFKDATNALQYQRALQIRNAEQDSLDDQFRKSEDIYNKQLDLNRVSYQTGIEDQQRELDEIHIEQGFEKEELYLESLVAEGQLRSIGLSGRTADKGYQVKGSDFGRQIEQLNEGFASGGKAAVSKFKELSTDRSSADLAAFASKMLDPGELPMPLAALPTPRAEFLYPRELQEFDFGPQPVRGVYRSPSAAAGRAWGSSIAGIAGSVGGFTSNLSYKDGSFLYNRN